MRGILGKTFVRGCCAVFVVGLTTQAYAGSLANRVNAPFGKLGIELDVQPVNGVAHRAHFTSASLATLGLLVKQLAPSASDFPAISTVPGFTFRYNPQIQAFERSSTSLGPVFVERPQTLGRGKLDFGTSYLSVDFDELNGKNLNGLTFRGLQHNDCCNSAQPPPSPNVPAFERDTAELTFQRFELRSHVVSFFATYGITDRWDINFLLPVVFTSLHIKALARLNNESNTNTHFFDVGAKRVDAVRVTEGDKAGVGDIQIRTKYHVLETNGFNLAGGLNLRIPTGDEDNFQGLGDATLTPFLSLAQEYGRFDFHASGGVELNFSDSDRSRARYAGGVTMQLFESVALLADVIGSSSLKSDRVNTSVRQFVNQGTSSEGTPNTIPVFVRKSARVNTDIVDLNVGFKISPFGQQRSVVGFGTVFIPLNNDGLRADAIPAVGLEYGF